MKSISIVTNKNDQNLDKQSNKQNEFSNNKPSSANDDDVKVQNYGKNLFLSDCS